mgnify:FL=1
MPYNERLLKTKEMFNMNFEDYKHVTEVINSIIMSGASVEEEVKKLQHVRRNILNAIFDARNEEEISKLEKFNNEWLYGSNN